MNKNKFRFYVVLAAITAAFLTLSLAIPFAHTTLFWVSLAFGLLAILIQLYSFPRAFDKGESVKSKFYGFPIANITAAYLAIQLILSFVFMALAFCCPLWVGLVLYVLLLCGAVIGFVAADAMRDEIERQDSVLKKDVSRMRAFQSRIANLSINAPASCKKLVDGLADEFRYSDPVSAPGLQEAENELELLLSELQQAVVEGNEESIAALCRRLSLTLSERNRLCKLNK